MNELFTLTSAALFFAGAAQAATITFSETNAGSSSFTSTDGSVLAEYVWRTGLAD